MVAWGGCVTGIRAMFSRYAISDPKTQKTIAIGGASYLWAGLFGAFYVMFKSGRTTAPEALGWHLLCWLTLVGLLLVTSTLSPRLQQFALVVTAPVLLAMLSARMMRLVRTGFRRRGWRVRRAD